MHRIRRIWLINGLDPIGELQSAVAIDGVHMGLVMAIGESESVVVIGGVHMGLAMAIDIDHIGDAMAIDRVNEDHRSSAQIDGPRCIIESQSTNTTGAGLIHIHMCDAIDRTR